MVSYLLLYRTYKEVNVKQTIFFFVLTAVLFGCMQNADDSKKELLIYCGITMIKPVSEIAQIIEKQENCKIIITKGGSGNLLKSLKTNQVGDLFLPGSELYIKTCLEEKIVIKTEFVGYNKAAMMVQKGNPKNIPADLDVLQDEKYYVVIGNHNSGSIGKETKKILEKKGIFKKVQKNARELTTDSKDLISVLKNKDADVVMNWFAASTWDENKDFVEALPIDEKFAKKKKLVIGLLTYSEHPEIAVKFMDYAQSKAGNELFRKYGLYDPE